MLQTQVLNGITPAGAALLSDPQALSRSWQNVREVMCKVSREVILPVKLDPRRDVYFKDEGGYREPVTEADREAGRRLVEAVTPFLQASYSEETAELDRAIAKARMAPALWLFDPLDGTQEFTDGLRPFSAIHAALLRRNSAGNYLPELGGIHQPTADRCFFNDVDGQVYVSESGKARLFKLDEPHEAGLIKPPIRCYYRYIDFESEQPNDAQFRFACNALATKLDRGHFLVPGGAAGSSFVDLITGHVDLVTLNRNYSKQWDLAMALPIIKALGGWLCDLDGNDFTCFNRVNYHNDRGYVASLKLDRTAVIETFKKFDLLRDFRGLPEKAKKKSRRRHYR